ncbi:MAG: adenylate/guanylate cyclase domain-containing protein [Rhodanobacteraceae bacterium]|nr:adenylate/guanylate cyclase domain-containing protein [Xanthomonadales bacterium]MCP5477981.1 adenylate/guanylate cyclase domain-containing protein [Rhodanobacteraceae bacterium]HPF73183.1 adenylate/guanylate cyclase domain-containing protein [Xanthomonadaceae bacterium]HRX98641.1 adenylate/guanylate cyclase domain-containing protein [Xanthomonadaceae bacterium]
MTKSTPLTILFADVSGSTRLFEQRGDVEARAIIAAVLGALSEVVSSHGGGVVKTIGDEIMCTFPGAMQGVLAGCDMQRRVAHDPQFVRDNIAIRIGLHHGDALVEDGDVYGDAVNTAARMASLAKREQIVTTAASVKNLTAAGSLNVRSLGKARVAGKLLPIEIVDVLWQEDTSNVTTVQRAIRVEEAVGRPRLTLRFRGQVIELDDQSQPFSLGREDSNTLTVEAEWVSRNHALIEYKRGHFMLSDRSTNGTYVKLGDDDELRLHRDEVHLRKSGTISLGQAVALNERDVLYFQCSEMPSAS